MSEIRTRLQRLGALGARAGKLILLVAFLAALMLWLTGAFSAKVAPGAGRELPAGAGLKTAAVQLSNFPLVLEQVGTLRARAEARVSSQIMAEITEILVRAGDEVKGPEQGGGPGTVLARLDDRDLRPRLDQALAEEAAVKEANAAGLAQVAAAEAQVDAAAAALRQAQADLGRYRELRAANAATDQQLEQAVARQEVAEAQVRAAQETLRASRSQVEALAARQRQAHAAAEEARVMLEHAAVTAPVSGVVIQKLAEVGDRAAPGQPLFVVAAPGPLDLEVAVSESLLPHVPVGKELEVRIDALNRTLDGVVREVEPRADPATRTVAVKVAVQPEQGLVSGLFGRLLVVTGAYQALVVPAEAVTEVGQLHTVEVAGADGRPHRRFVALGRRRGSFVEVLAGLKEQEAVVVP